MKCIRCNCEFDDYKPERNCESYGGPVYYACPHCGKLYKYSRIVIVNAVDDSEYSSKEFDDWGSKVILDKDYSV